MSDLRELYQGVILDHYRHPRNATPLSTANRRADGHNPLCGDRVTVYLAVEDGVVREAHCVGAGCAISTASASLMTEVVEGKSVREVEDLFERFRTMVTGDGGGALPEDDADLEKLAALSGVRDYPVRVKCATLAWHALLAALRKGANTVSTET